MFPILVRLPFLGIVLLVASGLAAVVAIWQLIAKERVNAAIAGVVSAALLGARFVIPKYWPNALDGSLPIYSYGVMLGLSLVVGWYLTLGLAERDGLPKETMANCYVVTAVAAVVGSRVLYVLTNLNEFDSIAAVFAFRRGGLVAYGGFLGGLAGSYFFLRRHRIPLLPWADVAVPSLASGLAITRVGCYLFGCDFGEPLSKDAPGWLKKIGTFPKWPEGTLDGGQGSPAFVHHVKQGLASPQDMGSQPVHPTQLYEALVGLGLLALLLVARRGQKFRGQIFFLFAFAYGACRYMLEILRDDAERGSVPFSLPKHVLVPLGLAIFAAGYGLGFSQSIKNIPLRRATQALSFLPAVVAYVLLNPETFAAAPAYQYSTSQMIGLTTGFAACVAFAVFHKAALAHPETAMDLGLPPAPKPAAQSDEDDDDEAPRAKKRKAEGAKSKQKAKPAPPPDEDEDDENAPAPAAAPEASDDDDDDAADKKAEESEKAAAEEPGGEKAKPEADEKAAKKAAIDVEES
jgi:phosphatidylglycerol---prolipoprotein diacylglyceryl transferase